MPAACTRRQRIGVRASHVTCMMCLTFFLSACLARSVTLSPRIVSDTIWYASARARFEGQDKRRLADSVEYGAAIYNRRSGADVFTGEVRLVLQDSVRYSRDDFMATLTQRVASGGVTDDFAVLYVHGFGTGLDECWSNPLLARIRSGSAVPWIAFCWPSHGSGITWPRGGSLVVRAYEEDTAAVMASTPQFKEVLHDVTTALGASHVLLTAHSLGARLVGETLVQSPTAADSQPPVAHASASGPFRAIAFLAPDLEATRFGDTLLPGLRAHAARIVLYSSRRDRALTISRRMHDTPRAGLAEPVPVLREGLETVDMTDGLNADGWWQRHFGNHHSIRRLSGTMWDLLHVVGGGLAPDCRAELGYGVQEENGLWRLLAGVYPDSTKRSNCGRHIPGADARPAFRERTP